MRITIKNKKYPELKDLAPEVVAVIVDEAVGNFLKTERGKTLCTAFSKKTAEQEVEDE